MVFGNFNNRAKKCKVRKCTCIFFFILPESCVLCHSAVRIREVTRSNSCVSFAARTWKSRLGVLTLPLPTAKVYMFGRCSPQDRVSLHCSFQNDAAVLDTRCAIRKNTECLTVPDNVRDPVSSIDCTAESTAVATLQHSLKKIQTFILKGVYCPELCSHLMSWHASLFWMLAEQLQAVRLYNNNDRTAKIKRMERLAT